MKEYGQGYSPHSKEELTPEIDLPCFEEMIKEWLEVEWVDPDVPPMPFDLHFRNDSDAEFLPDSEVLFPSQTLELWKPDPEKVYFRNGVVMNVIKRHNAEVWKSLDRGIPAVEDLLKGVPETEATRAKVKISPILNTVENSGEKGDTEQTIKVFTLYMGLSTGYVRYMLDNKMQEIGNNPSSQETKKRVQKLYKQIEEQYIGIMKELNGLGIDHVHTHRGNFCVHFRPLEREDIFTDEKGNAKRGEKRNFDPRTYFTQGYVVEVRLIDFDLARIDMLRINELVKKTGIEVNQEIVETLIDSEDVYTRAVGLMAINNQDKKELNGENTDYWQAKVMEKAMDEKENPELREASLKTMKKFTNWSEKTWRSMQALLQTNMLFLTTGLLEDRKWPQFIKDELDKMAQKKDQNALFVRVFLAYREKE